MAAIAELAVCRHAHRRNEGRDWTPSKPAFPILERQLRAATTAAEAEETEQRDAAATGNRDGLDAEDRERLELRKQGEASSNYIVSAADRAAQPPSDAEAGVQLRQ